MIPLGVPEELILWTGFTGHLKKYIRFKLYLYFMNYGSIF